MLRRALGIGITLLACAAFAGESTDVDPLRAPHRNPDGTFFNPWRPFETSFVDFLRWRFSSNAYDKSAAPVLPRVANDGRSLAGLQHSSELTWVGHATVAIHDGDDWSRRSIADTNQTLWCAWLLDSGEYTYFFAGDTGCFEGFAAYASRAGS